MILTALAIFYLLIPINGIFVADNCTVLGLKFKQRDNPLEGLMPTNNAFQTGAVRHLSQRGAYDELKNGQMDM